MCDLTEVIYSPNDVVWVKLGPVWWPGRVCGEDEIPPEIMKDLRKTPIAIVKFFQEDSFEYVKSLSNIYHYHCSRKNEFIKKGLDMLRSKNRGAPSNMKLFPEDVVRAEVLTHGNPAILQSDAFLPEEKPAYTDLFASAKKTPKRVKPDAKKKLSPVKQTTPRLITHPRFLQLSSGQSTDYEARERKQIPVRAECDEEDNSPPTLYSCTDCDYTTTRLNVMVWHNKSHTRNYASPQTAGKATKRKSTATVKLKERSSGGSPSVEPTTDEAEEVSAAKIPKTNGTLKVTRTPKTPGRKKGATAAKKTPTPSTPHTKEPNSTARTPAPRGRRGSAPKGDEIHKSLLEDWLEDDLEADELAADENSEAGVSPGENAAEFATSNGSKSKSCFDFDDSEDHLVIEKSDFKPGRKIPRLVSKSAPLTIAADDVVAIQDSTEAMEVDATAVNAEPKYQSGVEDSMDGESLGACQTSQLQEMGVDNEIEINTEETPVNEVVIEPVPIKKSRRIPKPSLKAKEAAELHDQVDKLLNEISKAPTKLPEIPRSHKKAQLKAYQQQAEAEEQAAQKAAQKAAMEAEAVRKAAIEAKAARKAAIEAEAAQKAAIEAEAAQKAAIEAEAAQKAAVEAEAAQKAAIEAEAAQKAAVEAEAALKAAVEAEAAQKAAVEAEAAQKAAIEAVAAQKAAIEAEATLKAALEVEAVQSAVPETETTVQAAVEKDVQLTVAEEAVPITAAQEETVRKVVKQNNIVVKVAASKIPIAEQNVKEQVASNLHPEMMDIDVSDIPLPSPQKFPVTSDIVDSSISIGANVTVADDETTDEQLSFVSSSNVSDEISVTKNVVLKASSANSTAVDQNVSVPHLSQAPTRVAGDAEISRVPAFADVRTLVKVETACKTMTRNATPVLRSNQPTLVLINKRDASSGHVSPSKTPSEPTKPVKTAYMVKLSQQSAGSPNQLIFLPNYNTKGGTSTAAITATAATTVSTPVARHISLVKPTTVRLTPAILQKSAAAQKVAAAALAKSTGKSIRLDANIFNSLFQVPSSPLSKAQSQIVIPVTGANVEVQTSNNAGAAVVAAPTQSSILYATEGVANSQGNCASSVVSSSSTAGQTVDYEYIVDSSGNLVQVDAPSSARTSTKDILAKALENTDGLQTEMALSEVATNSVLDACSVAQNTEMASKTEPHFENLTLNTAPIMSAFEIPSRVVATPSGLSEATIELATVGGDIAGSGDGQYLT